MPPARSPGSDTAADRSGANAGSSMLASNNPQMAGAEPPSTVGGTPSPAAVTPPSNLATAGAAPEQGLPEPRRDMPPIGAKATASSPPIAIPVPQGSPNAAAPYVESYDEVTYRSKAGDTFASISKEQYNSDVYASALLMYNRNHPQNQGPAADNLRRDQPVLQPGQPVYIPPMRILEKQFPIQGLTPVPPAPAIAPGANASPSPTPAPLTGTSNFSPGAPKTYQVRQPSETYVNIARQTLGNPERWWDIARLNPQIPPAYPVPGGTLLKMPPDARLSPMANP